MKNVLNGLSSGTLEQETQLLGISRTSVMVTGAGRLNKKLSSRPYCIKSVLNGHWSRTLEQETQQ
ncbi:hypothetical protein DPMN_097964 [Dreissena polymorpha]|uniref:Uncharacterized protein n=1 Tax=Dreissena polymorpha TaxID=45954 RepID=A0A9D4LB72_DREPO|nr:hypothetical protein DPMN_097964 [Dreissena polymorpha]